ncbi:MAG TPA: lipoyl(octanoyl) transferase LipB [Arthrobacter sp.]|nr:lipoyl(octanoyl) transferase LipB [Arthrobacter sp.]
MRVTTMTLEFSQLGLAPHFVKYEDGWAAQQKLHAEVLAGTAPSTVLLLEHEAVYTAGKRTEDHELPYDGTDVVHVDRGGKLTWHGPGQLVGYPILDLPDPIKQSEYVRLLEEVIITVLKDFGVEGEIVQGRSGVWLPADARGPARKIAAIGIRVANGVTMHGFAINCDNDLRPFGKIVPCGISDASVASIKEETKQDVSPADILPRITEELGRHEEQLVARRDTDGGAQEGQAETGGAQKEGVLL